MKTGIQPDKDNINETSELNENWNSTDKDNFTDVTELNDRQFYGRRQ